VAQPNARLSVFGRQLLVSRVAQGWSAAEAAKQLGVSRASAYKCLRRYRSEGQPACSIGAAGRTARRAACRTTQGGGGANSEEPTMMVERVYYYLR